jgi:hypothetical protein
MIYLCRKCPRIVGFQQLGLHCLLYSVNQTFLIQKAHLQSFEENLIFISNPMYLRTDIPTVTLTLYVEQVRP